jgi:hypothetical protein
LLVLGVDDDVGNIFPIDGPTIVVAFIPFVADELDFVAEVAEPRAELSNCLTAILAEVMLADVEPVESALGGAEAGGAAELETGMETGQKLHNCLPSSQYKSNSNRRKPTAIRFDKQFPKFASSYCRCPKHALERVTPGAVTKLIGTLRLRSR